MTRSIEYLAGLFDGEGSFSIQVDLRTHGERMSSRFGPSMSVNLYYGSDVLDHFVGTFGGTIYPYAKDGRPCGRRWNLGRRAGVLAAAVAIEPYLEIKRETAQNFIRALRMFPTDGTGANRKVGERVWAPETALAVAEIALTLNPARARKSNKTLEYVETMRAALQKEER